jgi:hypothetical protein
MRIEQIKAIPEIVSWGIISGIILFLLVYLMTEPKRLRARRAKFSASRDPLSDEAFLAWMRVSDAHRVYVVAARNALGKVFKVSPLALYPDDVPDDLSRDLLFDGWDAADADMELESSTGIMTDGKIPQFGNMRFFLFRRDGPATIGEWMRRVAVYLEKQKKQAGSFPKDSSRF